LDENNQIYHGAMLTDQKNYGKSFRTGKKSRVTQLAQVQIFSPSLKIAF
jgi:hypothetical protein